MLRRTTLAIIAVIALASLGPSPIGAGTIPQGTQSNAAYTSSGSGVTAVSATTQQVSCYRPMVPFATSDGPNDGYTGESVCPGATTGEDQGPYPTQAGGNPGYPAASAMLVKDHSESDIRVDPLDPMHVIGTSKWFVSAEGYNHLLGFYELFDGGATWPVQGHIPGYEGWTDNTDPVGALDRYGNFYALGLPYQFFYNADDSHNFAINKNKEPNPSVPAEAISMSVRPHGPNMPQGATYLLPHVAPDGSVWTTLTNGGPAHQYASDKIVIVRSTDGGSTWSLIGTAADKIVAPPFIYANTTFRDGILNSF